MNALIMYYLPDSISDPRNAVNVIKSINLGGYHYDNADLRIEKRFDLCY